MGDKSYVNLASENEELCVGRGGGGVDQHFQIVPCKTSRLSKIALKSTRTLYQLTGDNIGLVQTKLTALQNLIRPARLALLLKFRPFILLFLLLLVFHHRRLRRLEFGGDDLEIVMMGLVDVLGHVDVAVKRARRFQESRGGVLESLADKVLRKRRAEAKVVDDVRDVRHVRGQVVMLRLGLYVEVSRRPIDEEEAGEETARVVIVFPRVLYVAPTGLKGSGVGEVFFRL